MVKLFLRKYDGAAIGGVAGLSLRHTGAQNFTVNRCTFSTNNINVYSTGIYFSNVKNVKITDSTFTRFTQHISVQGYTYLNMTGNTARTTIYNIYRPVHVDGQYLDCVNNDFNLERGAQAADNCIYIRATVKGNITNCIFSDSGRWDAIQIYGDDLNVIGNTFKNFHINGGSPGHYGYIGGTNKATSKMTFVRNTFSGGSVGWYAKIGYFEFQNLAFLNFSNNRVGHAGYTYFVNIGSFDCGFNTVSNCRYTGCF